MRNHSRRIKPWFVHGDHSGRTVSDELRADGRQGNLPGVRGGGSSHARADTAADSSAHHALTHANRNAWADTKTR
jgi:hypothetical protein